MDITLFEWTRMALLYTHLLSCALALALVLHADFGIARGSFRREALGETAHRVTWLLSALWLSGLALVYLDTGFDPGKMAAMPKLLIKLACVTVLTINGAILHRVAFPLMSGESPLTLAQGLLLAVCGAVSTGHWLLAAFLGIAKPLGRLPLETLGMLYALVFFGTVLAAGISSPFLRRQLDRWRMKQRLARPVVVGNRTAVWAGAGA